MVVVKAPFDPITQKELDELKRIARRDGSCSIMVEEDGILPYAKRVELVRKAIQPFSKISLVEETMDEVVSESWFYEEEALVRKGYFYKAAQGIRKDLAIEGLYLLEVVKARCNPRRASHSVAVANVCKELAFAHGLDCRRAYIAGMLHDLTKNVSDEENAHILSVYDPSLLELSNKVWHSFTCPIVLKQDLGISDEKVLNAIYHHTLGTSFEPYAMILYIADKCEPTRGYDSSYELSLSKKDLKRGFLYVKEEAKKYIQKQGKGIV